MNIAQNMLIWALMYLGELGEVSRRVPALLADARRRGESLSRDRAVHAQQLRLARRRRSRRRRARSDRGHRAMVAARVFTASTTAPCWRACRPRSIAATGDAAWRLLVEQEADLRRSMLMRVQALRIETLYLRGRSALAIAAANASARRRFLAIARAYARRIARERMPWSDPIALLLQRRHRVGRRRRQAAAVGLLEEAVDRFDRADMELYAAVARRRLGALRGDEQGRELQRQAETWMARSRSGTRSASPACSRPALPTTPSCTLRAARFDRRNHRVRLEQLRRSHFLTAFTFQQHAEAEPSQDRVDAVDQRLRHGVA